MKLHFQDHARPGIVAALAALGCVAAPLAFGHGTATTTSSTQEPGYAESSVSSTSDSNAVTTTTRQSTSSSGPTVQGTSTFSNAAGASVDGTAAANDQRLMDEVISALAADPTLKGANVNLYAGRNSSGVPNVILGYAAANNLAWLYAEGRGNLEVALQLAMLRAIPSQRERLRRPGQRLRT